MFVLPFIMTSALLVASEAVASDAVPSKPTTKTTGAPAVSPTTAPELPNGTATLPLQALAPLYAMPKAEPSAHSPIDAVVLSHQLSGRLTPDALIIDSQIEVQVLNANKWIKLRLFHITPETYVTSLEVPEGATVAVVDGELCLLSQRPGNYALSLHLSSKATGSGKQRTTTLTALNEGLQVPMKVDAALLGEALVGDSGAGDKGSVYPLHQQWQVRWQNNAPELAKKEVAHLPLEPKIVNAKVVIVSTLEGKARINVSYHLALDRQEELWFEVPEKQHLVRAAVNGAAVVAKTAVAKSDGIAQTENNSQRVTVSVQPTESGATEGTLELELSEELGVFHLSGELQLTLPKIAWPVAAVEATTFLPNVFNYHRQGGSMEDFTGPAASQALPGKMMQFRQFLVAASAPSIDLSYSVDLTDRYFK